MVLIGYKVLFHLRDSSSPDGVSVRHHDSSGDLPETALIPQSQTPVVSQPSYTTVTHLADQYANSGLVEIASPFGGKEGHDKQMRLEHGFISPSLVHEFEEGYAVSRSRNDLKKVMLYPGPGREAGRVAL